MIALGDLLSSGGDSQSSSPSSGGGGLGASLSDLFGSTIQSVAKSASNALTSGVDRVLSQGSQSSTTAPVPDIASNAARSAGTFVSGAFSGLSPMVLVGGVAILAFVLLRRK